MESRESIDLDFGKYLLIVKRQWLPATTVFIATVALSALATTRLKPSYEAGGKLLFKIPSFNVVGSNLLSSKSEGSGDLTSLVSTQNPISTQMEVITSPSILQTTIDKLKLRNDEGEPLTPDKLKSALKLKIIGGTDVLEITYKSRNPKETAAVVNKIMNEFLENDILSNRVEAEAARQFMDRQLPTNQNAVRRAEASLRRFKQTNNIVDLSEEIISAVKVIGILDEQINNVKAELAQVTAQTQQLNQQLNITSKEAMAMSAISQSPAIQGILTQIQDTERQLAIESSRFQDNNPIITSLEAKKVNLNNILQQQILATVGSEIKVSPGLLQIGELKQTLIQDFIQSEVQRLGLNQKYISLYKSRSAYQQRLKVVPQLAENQRELERKVEVAQSTYQTLLKKVQELQVAENNNTANARIIAQAKVPEKPAGGKKVIVLAIGVLFGAFLGTTTILLLEMRDRSLKTLQEIRDIFGYTLLGILPSLSKKSLFWHQNADSTTPEIAAKDAPQSLTSEMYRVTQANLRLLSSDTVIKSIVVTSSISKEGKSTVAANLATVISQLGRKVLLIDADLRVPTQHHFWQISNSPGLSEVLVAQVEYSNSIFRVMDNLDVLPAGVRPPNPLALLDSKRMAALIEEFSSAYDFVIIDTPPLLVGADAVTVSQMTDGMLLVARPGMIDYHNANTAKEMLKRSNYNVLGLLVNGIIEKNEPNNYFYSPEEYYSASKTVTKKDRIKA
ncbi:GumC family protein [Anabaena catenula]|uniref:non-specific protein-tyrosine kinase n=1 Tax=Anabaena catenula FACHB-362 TaxID=2692877 RepID=A0ABR8IWM6_9NOST|nr:polysaccharide biosynthesis tyrosine autokinase [Anabaena catenula]MBD2690459.1 polysaccharide biosynthesis tyrosine autokinase [Anabaena catenula FACHB-362]